MGGMGNLYLVRHGQASFGADDYDQLSALGQRQAQRLGAYFQDKGLRFDAVLMGTLRRHAQTWEGIAEGAGRQNMSHLQPVLAAFNACNLASAYLERGNVAAARRKLVQALASVNQVHACAQQGGAA